MAERVSSPGPLAVARRMAGRQLRAHRARRVAKLPPTSAFPTDPDILIVCPTYPGGESAYGGQFVERRVRAIRNYGYSVGVVEVREGRISPALGFQSDVPVWRTSAEGLGRWLPRATPRSVAIHHPEPQVWEAVKPALGRMPVMGIFHGYACRSWRLLEASYSDEDLESLAPTLDARDLERQAALRDMFADDRFIRVFVSDFLRGVAEDFAGADSAPSHVIPNPIPEFLFPYRAKSPEDRFRVLWVRAMNFRNYSNDLARDALLELDRRGDLDRFHVTIRGDGTLFEESVGPLRRFANIDIERGFVSTEDMAELHATHGVMLVPTRWDSQGLTCGEAMSSGLVPVTNAVTAIPEFVGEGEGLLCPPDSPVALADALMSLGDDPALFLSMSSAAATRAQAQCGLDRTVGREIALLGLGRN